MQNSEINIHGFQFIEIETGYVPKPNQTAINSGNNKTIGNVTYTVCEIISFQQGVLNLDGPSIRLHHEKVETSRICVQKLISHLVLECSHVTY